MLRDIEDTLTYQRLVQKGRVDERLLEVRQNIEAMTQRRFPSLLVRVKAQAEQLVELEKLQAFSFDCAYCTPSP